MKLDSGAMSSLLLARHTSGGAPVALRFMPEQANLPQAEEMADVSHPNLIAPVASGRTENLTFVALPYVAGCSVAQLLYALSRHRRRMAPALAVYIARQALEGLSALRYVGGRPHGALTPHHLVLSEDGQVRLMYFAEAPSVGARFRRGAGKGPGFRHVPPEVLESGQADSRSDVYAMGAVLWEMLTGRPLFHGMHGFEVLDAVRAGVQHPPSAHARHVEHELDNVVMRALSLDPARRPSSIHRFSQALLAVCPESAGVNEAGVAELLGTILVDREGKAQLSAARYPETPRGLDADVSMPFMVGEYATEPTEDESHSFAAESNARTEVFVPASDTALPALATHAGPLSEVPTEVRSSTVGLPLHEPVAETVRSPESRRRRDDATIPFRTGEASESIHWASDTFHLPTGDDDLHDAHEASQLDPPKAPERKRRWDTEVDAPPETAKRRRWDTDLDISPTQITAPHASEAAFFDEPTRVRV